MKTIILLSCILLVITLEGARSSKAAGPVDWVEQTVSPDTTAATAAQKYLRDAGPTGLVMLQERLRLRSRLIDAERHQTNTGRESWLPWTE